MILHSHSWACIWRKSYFEKIHEPQCSLQLYKTWKQPKCPWTDEWIKNMQYTFTMEYFPAIKKNEIMPFVATWIDLEIIILSEINQKEKDKYHMISLICGI